MRALVPEIESLLFYDPSHDRMELYGPGFLEYAAGGISYRVGHFSFFQVNRFLVEELARVVVEGEEGGRLALDLFAGVGLFSIPLAAKIRESAGGGIESSGGARSGNEFARARDHRSADGGCRALSGTYRDKPDLVVLDPPRAGLTPGLIKRLCRIGPDRITYISCEPPALARDLAALQNGGYELSDLQLFDLFPQTFHMEAVARLRRRA